jgi:hypothetical protein
VARYHPSTVFQSEVVVHGLAESLRASLCRIPDYAESSMKHLHLALSWRTETIKRFGIAAPQRKIGIPNRPTMSFAQAYVAVTFVIDLQTSLGEPTGWGRR